MNQLLAYQIGGIFLLCALLMFGTVSGFTGRFRLGTAPLLAIVASLLLFLLYRHAADLLALWPSSASQHVAEPIPVPASPAVRARPKPRTAKSELPFKGVVTKLDPEPAPDAAPVAGGVAIQPTPEPTAPIALVTASPPPDPSRYLAPHENSPYDSKTKRAVRSVGRFLHVIPKQEKVGRN